MMFVLSVISVPAALLAFFTARAERDSSQFVARGIWVGFACTLVVLFAFAWQNVEGASMMVVMLPHFVAAIALGGAVLGGCAGFAAKLVQRSRQAARMTKI